jgi:hypothetical protein
LTVAAIKADATMLVEARELISAFQTVVRKRSLGELNPCRSKPM